MGLCTFQIARVFVMRAHIDSYEYGWNALQEAPVNVLIVTSKGAIS